MCGIIGAWLPKNTLTENDFSKIVDTIYHRGPDDDGKLIENDFYLGMRRLSIIDLKSGQQPVFNEDKSKAVFFNGEIYNYKDLSTKLKSKGHHVRSECDTEVIVHSMEEGFDAIESFRGMFAFCYVDREKQELNLFRDRIGVKPLYYIYEPGKIFAFASEIKGLEAICTAVNYPLEINEEAIYHYLSFSNIPQPLTIYQNIYALPPGHHLKFNKNSIEIKKYWQYNYEPKATDSLEGVKERIYNELTESVRLRLHSDVPIGLFLSGGIDSSVVAYLAAKELNCNLKTFTVGFPGHRSFDESLIAKNTASALGLENEILPLELDPLDSLEKITSIYDQPFADPSAIPSVEISRLASRHVKVVLNGDGGDEQFGGYRRYVLANNLSKIPNISFLNPLFEAINPERRSYSGFLQRLIKNSGLTLEEQNIALSSDMLLDSQKSKVLSSGNKFSTRNLIAQYSRVDCKESLDQIMHFDRNLNLLSGLLVKMDMASSSSSIEARSPFLDHKLFEKSSLLPSSFKVNGTTTKFLLKELFKDKLHAEVIYGKKRGFEIPLKSWLTNQFCPIINELLTDRNSLFYSYISFDFVQAVFTTDRYKNLNVDYLRYSMLILYIWFKNKFY